MSLPNLFTRTSAPLPPLLRALAALLLLSLCSCAGLRRMEMRPTEVFYLANTPEQFAPKPPDFPRPMLNQAPPKSRMIGTFQFRTEKGRDFAIRSALHNGRRVGADSVWVRHINEWAEPFAYDVPAHWETRWETIYRTRVIREKRGPGMPDAVHQESFPVTIQRNEWHPTQHVSGYHHYTSIDALMFRLK